MEKEIIPYEQALALKELGFDEPCFGYWRNENLPNPITIGQYTTKEDMEYEISGQDEYHNFENIIALAPLYQQAFRWLLKHHNLYGVIIPTETMNWTFKTMTVVEGIVEVPPYKHVDSNDYGTPEEAELACLIKLIEIVKTK